MPTESRRTTPTRRRHRRLLALTLLLAIAWAELSWRHGWLELADNAVYDLWHRIAGVRQQPQHVALAVIDDAALAIHPDDPLVFWTPHVAKAAEVLHQVGASAVGLDFLFAISPERWLGKMNLVPSDISREFDVPFRAAINNGRLLLVGAQLRDKHSQIDRFLLPERDYLLAVPDFDFANHIGLSDLNNDIDGTVRSFVVAPTLHLEPGLAEQNLPRLSFAALLALHSRGLSAQAASWQLAGQRISADARRRSISFVGPPGTVPRISLARLLASNALQDPAVRAMRGKVVIIGGEFMGIQDLHFTPYSGGFSGVSGRLMTGPEVQANIVETLLAGNIHSPAPMWQRLLYFSLLIGSALWLFVRTTPWLAALAGLSVASLGSSIAYAAFLQHLDLPLACLCLGLLLACFAAIGIRLSGEERERQRITQLFGRYVSDNVVDMLLHTGTVPKLGGENWQITILFSDIRNFTSLSEKLSATEVVELLNEYFKRVCEPILAHNGTIDKFIGDAVMAYFGWPINTPGHANQALDAALAMQQVAHEFQRWIDQRFAGRELLPFRVGVGVHTGQAVLGNIGSPRHTEFTAIGDNVNIASRLESQTKEFGCDILASRDTIDACGGSARTGRHQTIQVKGRAQTVEVFEILGNTRTKETP